MRVVRSVQSAAVLPRVPHGPNQARGQGGRYAYRQGPPTALRIPWRKDLIQTFCYARRRDAPRPAVAAPHHRPPPVPRVNSAIWRLASVNLCQRPVCSIMFHQTVHDRWLSGSCRQRQPLPSGQAPRGRSLHWPLISRLWLRLARMRARSWPSSPHPPDQASRHQHPRHPPG